MANGLSLDEGKQALSGGARFGMIFPQLEDPNKDGDTLKAFFCYGEHVQEDSRTIKRIGIYWRPLYDLWKMKMRRSGSCFCCAEACGSTNGGCG